MPLPIFAPKARSKVTLMPINGFHEALTISAFTKYHNTVFKNPAPLSNLEPSKADNLTPPRIII